MQSVLEEQDEAEARKSFKDKFDNFGRATEHVTLGLHPPIVDVHQMASCQQLYSANGNIRERFAFSEK
jgi:spore coat protein CotH